MRVTDALGQEFETDEAPQRIVSLVPSITEALFAYGAGPRVAGLTSFCVEPAGLVEGKPQVGGTKTVEVAAVLGLQPDLVIASAEENERAQVEELVAANVRVYVIEPRTVDGALVMLSDLARLTATASVALPKIMQTSRTLAQVKREAEKTVRVFCPVWRRPYMSVGPDTYIHDLMEACGGLNIFGKAEGHYPEVTLDEAASRDPEVVLLPDEPYPFAEKHLSEVMAGLANTSAVREGRVHLVDGKMLSWYGPRISSALFELSRIFVNPAI